MSELPLAKLAGRSLPMVVVRVIGSGSALHNFADRQLPCGHGRVWVVGTSRGLDCSTGELTFDLADSRADDRVNLDSTHSGRMAD
jgi:hypothetical protein